jgi:hypothetical protein
MAKTLTKIWHEIPAEQKVNTTFEQFSASMTPVIKKLASAETASRDALMKPWEEIFKKGVTDSEKFTLSQQLADLPADPKWKKAVMTGARKINDKGNGEAAAMFLKQMIEYGKRGVPRPAEPAQVQPAADNSAGPLQAAAMFP